MPIRKGDGTPLRFSGFSQARLGNGTQLWSPGRFKGDIFYVAAALDDAVYGSPVANQYDLQAQQSSFGREVGDTASTIVWDDTGNRFYVGITGGTDQIEQYSASNNYTFANATLEGAISADADLQSFRWNDDGTKFYTAIAGGHDEIREHSVSSAFDLTSTVTQQNVLSVGSSLRGLEWNDDGSKLFVARGFSVSEINEYTLGTKFSTSTASQTDTMSTQTEIVGVAWSSDGTLLYEAGADNLVYVYSTTTFSLSSPSLLYSESVPGSDLGDICWDHCPQYPTS